MPSRSGIRAFTTCRSTTRSSSTRRSWRNSPTGFGRRMSMSDDRAPYPGLRPFEADEADLFFGREQHVDALLERLSGSRFVAVVGESGAGKSSLVRAGLLPALEAGFVVEAGSDWRVALMRPGGAPLQALADALLMPG